MAKTEGTVYLLHFDRPYRHARHYVGWASDLDGRLEHHRKGTGARLMAVIAAAGIGFVLARTWPGDRTLERRIKNRHETPRLCPVCRGEAP
jgi:predicted GIY-YIG superfamily endonuclease